MEQSTIARHISALGQRDFGAIATLILTKVFGLRVANVDGPGDGGGDLRPFFTPREKLAWVSTVFQTTVTGTSWQQKAFEDAKKAADGLNAHSFYFLTSKAHSHTDFIKVQSRIQNELDLIANCYGANEIAGLILSNDLLRDFADVIQLPCDIPLRNRPDKQEILLHAFATLSNERNELKTGVFDDAILISLYDYEHLSLEELVHKTLALAGLSDGVEEKIRARIDSLFSRGKIKKINGHLILSPQVKLDLSITNGIYIQELQDLGSAQQQIIASHGGRDWSKEDADEAAVLLTRLFVKQQIETTENASLPLTTLGLSKALGQPQTDLTKKVRATGLSIAKSNKVIEEFVRIASERPIVKKLSRAVTFVATEGRSIAQACKALSAASWSDVFVTLDASVAIPYLCTSMFSATDGRFSRGSNQCIKSLRALNAKLVMPYFYINETASHLLRALSMPDDAIYHKAAEQSENGFVAHYYQMKNRGQSVPPTIREFVEVFSRSATSTAGTSHERARLMMPDVQACLRNYGVEFEHVETLTPGTVRHSSFQKDIESAMDYLVGGRKPFRLINNDVRVLANSRLRTKENGESRMCLTWDKTLIKVGAEVGQGSRECGWVVTPSEAADLVITDIDFEAMQLTSLAHAIARADSSPESIGAKMLDRVASIATDKRLDWQFQAEFKKFFIDTMARVQETPTETSWVSSELDMFLSSFDPDDLDVDFVE